MNVNIFGGKDGVAYPNVGWYFLAAIVLMIFVLFLWYCVKHSLQRRRQTPYQRGFYETLYAEIEDEYPAMWAHDGAIEDVTPDGLFNQLKWRLLKRWFAPERTIDMRLYQSLSASADDSDLGTWARIKRYLLWRWLPQIRSNLKDEEMAMVDVVEPEHSASAPASLRYDPSTITELAKASTPVAMANAEPTAVQQLSTMGLQPLTVPDKEKRRRSSLSSLEGRRSSSDERPSSRGSSEAMFEEIISDDDGSDAGEGASKSSHEREQAQGA